MGQRHRRTRARLPRHLPGHGVRPSRRQHRRPDRRRAADAAPRRRSRARHRRRLRGAYRPDEGDQPAPPQEGPRRPPRRRHHRRHRRAARPAHRDRLSGPQPGGPSRLLHPPVAQGRDYELEGLRARLLGQAGDRGGRPGDARGGGAEPDLRGRGLGDRLDARRRRRPLPCTARGAGRAAAPDPGIVHQGALGRVPGAGADRPRPRAARPDRRSRRH